MNWTCPHCGAGQVLQLEVAGSPRMTDLHNILGGMALRGRLIEDVECELKGSRSGGLGGS
jgi:hypothetical protein